MVQQFVSMTVYNNAYGFVNILVKIMDWSVEHNLCWYLISICTRLETLYFNIKYKIVFSVEKMNALEQNSMEQISYPLCNATPTMNETIIWIVDASADATLLPQPRLKETRQNVVVA